LNFLLSIFKKEYWGDKSQHRIHTVTDKKFRYEDLCM